jgi:hypothetical protein
MVTGGSDDVASLAAISSNGLFFLADYDGAIGRAFGASEMPRTIVLGRREKARSQQRETACRRTAYVAGRDRLFPEEAPALDPAQDNDMIAVA